MMKCAFATTSGRGQRGTATQNMPGYRMKNKQKVFRQERKRRRSGQETDVQKIDCRKNVMEKGDDKIDEDLATIQKAVEIAAGRVAHHTKAEKTNYRD